MKQILHNSSLSEVPEKDTAEDKTANDKNYNQNVRDIIQLFG